MKLLFNKLRSLVPDFFLKITGKALAILLFGLAVTFFITFSTKKNVERDIQRNFEFNCNNIEIEIKARLKAHAQLLRSGAAFFAASDSVTREEWRKFNGRGKINKNLPGIQGVGFAYIIPKKQLNKHIQFMQKEGFPDYSIKPEGERDIYTSIIYLEPFSGRNIRAFGFDMFSEPIRRKAMEISRDSDIAMLSGKVLLVQETDEDIQAGCLMYVPVYQNGLLANTIHERRTAIKGWVYSPYRMNDLMKGILGNKDLPNKNRIRLKIYDNDVISDETILYDSQSKENGTLNTVSISSFNLPIEFNGKKWTLQFLMPNENLFALRGKVIIVLISGLSISFLLFTLSLALFKSKFREQQILILNKQLETHNLEKDRFISMLAHDIKSPFSAQLGFTDLLATNIRKYSIDKIETHVNIINQSTKNIYNLLEDILMWARTQSSKLPYEPEKYNVSTLCNNVIEGLKLNAENKNIKINQYCSCDLYVYADKNMVNTILRNLISNAIKFTDKGGQIDIFAIQCSTNVTMTISDNGIGIDPELIPNLFNNSRFHSTDGTNKEKGTGLGLLLCKEFVQKNGGTIWVESEAGKGTSFKFTLKSCEPMT